MANWYLSSNRYKTLEQIFQKQPPPLYWRFDIQPLFEELKTQLDGDPIPKEDDELKHVKLDNGCRIEILSSGRIESNVVRSKIKVALETAGVKPVPPPKGLLAHVRAALPLKRYSAILPIIRPCPPEVAIESENLHPNL